MKKAKTPSPSKPKKSPSPRKKGEQTRFKKEKPQGLSLPDKDFLIHELRTHQIELETQNEELRTAQQDLDAARRKYANFYDFAPVGYFRFDRNGLIRDVNLTGTRLLGTDKSHVLNKPFSLFVQPEDADRFREHRLNVIQSGSQQTCELRIKKKDGSLIHAELRSSAIEDEGDAAGLCLTTVNDISERKNFEQMLQESEQRYRALVETAPEAICVQQGGIFIYLNPVGMDLFGAKNPEEIIGSKVLDRIHPDSQPIAQDCMRTVEDEGMRTLPKEMRVLRLDGQVVEVEAVACPIAFHNSPATQVVMKDITERKMAEKSLRFKADVLSQVNDAVIVTDNAHRITYWNHGAERLYRYSAEETLGRPVKEIIPLGRSGPDDKTAAHDAPAGNGFLRGEGIHRTKDGKEIHVESSVSVLKDETGDSVGLLAVIHDISERKHAERNLRESEERYRSLIESSPEAICVQQKGLFVYMNRAGLELLGAASFEQLRGKKILDYIHPDFREKALERAHQVEEKGQQAPWRQFKILQLNGQEIDVEAAATPVTFGGMPAVQVIIKDITDRQNTELRLRLQATVLSQVNDAVVAVGRDRRIIFWNKGAERLYKVTAQEAIGRERKEIYRYRWATPADERAARKTMASTGFLCGENIHILSSGEEIYVESSVAVLTDWSYAPAGWIAVMRDITDRKIFERKLTESEERYRSLVESSPDAILVHQDGKLVYVNPASVKLMGARDMNELIGKEVLDFIHPDFHRSADERSRRVEEEGLAMPSRESRIKRLDGSLVDVEAVGASVTFGGRPAMQIIAQDITERKKFEEALRDSERLYRLMFESNPHPMWIYDTKTLRFLFVNDAAIARYGYSKEEFLSKTIKDIRPRENVQVTLDNVSKIAAGLYDSGSWKHEKKDGTIIDVEIISHNLKVDGKDARVVLAHDITARKKAEAALRESQQAYRTLAENLPGIVYRVFSRENKRIQFFNKTASAIIGYRDDELSGGEVCSLETLVLPEDRPMLIAAVQAAIEGKSPFTAEYRLRHRSGEVRFMLEQGAPIYGDDGNLLYIDGVISDVTERKKAEGALRESEERQRAVFDNSPTAIFAKDRQGRFILFNRQAELWVGKGRDEVLGKTDYDIFPKDVADRLRAADRRVLETGKPLEAEETITACGQKRIALDIKFPLFDADGRPYAVCGIATDITERNRAEQAIKEARDSAILERNRLGTILNTIPSGVFVAEGPDANITLENEQAKDILGKDLGDAVTASDRIQKYRIQKSDGTLFKAEELPYLRALLNGEDVRDVEMTLKGPDGRLVTVLANAAPLHDSHGNIIASVTAFSDITERKEAEDALKRAQIELELRVRERTSELGATVAALQSEIAERKRTAAERDKLVAAVESTAEAVVVTDKRGLIEYVNPAFEQITGYRRHEVVGRDLHFLDSGQHDQEFFRRMRETMRDQGVWKGRLINKKKDGTIYYEDCTYSPVRDRSGNTTNYVSIKHDVTENLRLESIAETIDTMNNIGYVFSGIRHEIGNPVSSLLIIMGLLKKKYETSPKETIKDYLDQAVAQVERIEYLLTSLKNFNMYENLQIRNTEVSSFMEKFTPLVTADLSKKGVAFHVEPIPEAWMSVDPRALQQALVNVVVNASEAVAALPRPEIVLTVFKNRGMVQIRVSDNGTGIPEDRKKNLFKPFYTTKSNGTGLGLVITRKLVSRMKGFIEIESRKDQGTTVDIYLPEGTVERTAE